MRTPKLLLFAAATSLAFVACRKDKADNTPDMDITAASDNSKADDAFTDILYQVDKAASDHGLRDACDPTVTFDTISMPHTMTLDFGSVNCTASNGRLRRGRLNVSFTGRYRDAGTVITITPENYYLNNRLVSGTKTVTNMGLDANGHIYFNITVNGSLTDTDGTVATHHAQRVRTWIAGSDTPQCEDDVYLITGSGNGVNRHGVAYTSSITQALRVDHSCAFRITQGTVQITPSGRPVRTIDYGNGTCDDTFTITVNGTTHAITIG